MSMKRFAVFLVLAACLLPAASSVRAQLTPQVILTVTSLEGDGSVLEPNRDPTAIHLDILTINFVPHVESCRLIRQLDAPVFDPVKLIWTDLVYYPLPTLVQDPSDPNHYTVDFTISTSQTGYFPTSGGFVRLAFDCNTNVGPGNTRTTSNQETLLAGTPVEPSADNQTFASAEGDCAINIPGGVQTRSAFVGTGKPKSGELPPGISKGCVGVARPTTPQSGYTFTGPIQLSISTDPVDCQNNQRYYLVQQILQDLPLSGALGPGLSTVDTALASLDSNGFCRIFSKAIRSVSNKPGKGNTCDYGWGNNWRCSGDQPLSGIFGSGVIGAQLDLNSGWVQGRVCAQINQEGNPVTSCAESSTSHPIPIPFAKVQNLSDYPNVDDLAAQVFFTDAAGRYIVPILNTSWMVFVYDPFGCGVFTQATAGSMGKRDPSGTVKTQLDIVLSTGINGSGYQLTRNGIRHGGFEGFGKGAFFKCWVPSPATNVSVVTNSTLVDFDNGNLTLTPSEGSAMAVLNANGGIVTLAQTFKVPTLANETRPKQLSLDFNFGCASGGTCVSTDSNSSANFVLGLTDQQKLLSNSTGGWMPVNFDVSSYAPGTQLTLTVKLNTTSANSNNMANLRLAVDHVRFDEVAAYSNIAFTSGDGFTPVAATEAAEQVKWANVLLSQIGVSIDNKGTTSWNTQTDPSAASCNSSSLSLTGGTNYTDVTWGTAIRLVPGGTSRSKGVVTEESKALLCMATARNRPSSGFPSRAVQIVHVPKLFDVNQSATTIYGAAITRDDYHGETTSLNRSYDAGDDPNDPNSNATGLLISNLTSATDKAAAVGRISVLAHEFSHLLIQPDNASGLLEHLVEVSDLSNNMVTGLNLCVPQISSALPTGFTYCSSKPNMSVGQGQAVNLPDP